MKSIETFKSIAATLFWWPILVLDLLCLALMVTVLPGRLRNGAVLRAVSSVLLKAAGVRVQVQGIHNIIRDRSQIFVANHESWFDSFILAAVLPIPVTFVSKKEMFRVPIYSYIMRRLRFVSMDRANPHNDLKSIEATAALLQSHLSIVVFPEGTMSRTGKLGSFKRGAVYLAANANIPITPITVTGTRKIKSRGSPWIHFGMQTEVIISEPVEVGGLKREEQRTAMENIRTIIERHLIDTGIPRDFNNELVGEVECDAIY
ncbi:MAG: 1-acyl-sn-glycerol-3-phosphate acyltransferase [Candidatus Aegiribacteria sp.]|nr:1-acyl-sn-glycerol-3-phosphate acyltransferase [Candidatus Aegiribacteria sp.]